MATYGNNLNQTHEIQNIVGQSLFGNYANAKIQYDKAFDYYVHTNPNSKVARSFGRKKGRMGGRKKVGLITTSLPQSMGNPAFEDSYFDEPSTGEKDNPELKPRKRTGRLRFTGETARQVAAGDLNFVNVMTKDVEDGETAWNINHIRNLVHGSPDILGVVSSVVNTYDITLKGRNSRDSDAADFFACGAHHLENGMYVGFVDVSTCTNGVWEAPSATMSTKELPTAGGNGAGVRVSALVRDTASAAGTFTLVDTAGTAKPPANVTSGTALTIQENDLIIAFGSRKGTGNTTYGAEGATTEDKLGAMNGVVPIAAGSRLQGYLYTLPKATIPGLKGYYDHGSGTKRAFTDQMITVGGDLIEETGNGKENDWILCNKSARRQVVAEHAGEVLYSPVQEAERGFRQLMHVGGDRPKPYFTDRAMLPSCFVLPCTETWGYWSNMDFQSLGERWIVNKDGIERPYVQAGNVECTNPSNNGMIDDIADDVFATT